MAGRVDRLWIKRFRRGPMDAVERAELRAGRGLVGNADQGGWRQVTIIARRRWDGVNETMADDIDPAVRRANMLVAGIDLDNTRGRTLRIGFLPAVDPRRDAALRAHGRRPPPACAARSIRRGPAAPSRKSSMTGRSRWETP